MILRQVEVCLLSSVCVLALGCGPSADYKPSSKLPPATKKEHDHATHEGAHLHYGAGPHGGAVVELGGDDYHAELVFDHDAHALQVFLLKADAKSPLPTKTAEATLAQDEGKSLSLKASPLDGESDGLSSRFQIVDEALVHSILEKGFLHGDLTVQIDGKSFKSHLDLHFDNIKHEHKDATPKDSESKRQDSESKK